MAGGGAWGQGRADEAGRRRRDQGAGVRQRLGRAGPQHAQEFQPAIVGGQPHPLSALADQYQPYVASGEINSRVEDVAAAWTPGRSIDIDGNPLAARKFTPVTDEDKRLWEHTQTLKDLRGQYEPEPLVKPLPATQRTF